MQITSLPFPKGELHVLIFFIYTLWHCIFDPLVLSIYQVDLAEILHVMSLDWGTKRSNFCLPQHACRKNVTNMFFFVSSKMSCNFFSCHFYRRRKVSGLNPAWSFFMDYHS